MTEKVPVVPPSSTLAETSSLISTHIKEFETIDYIYVVDASRKLLGVFSIKELYRSPPSTKVGVLYKKTPFVTVLPTSEQEEVGYLALKHNIKAIPVVDHANTFLGVIPNDTLISILYKELREDMLYMAGVHRAHLEFDNVLETPLPQTVAHRLPWLFIGLLGGLAAAHIIGYFENTLEENLVLAAFIPLVVYIADAVGTQLEAFTIRDFALFRKLNFGRYFLKQFFAVLVIAIILGVVLTVISSFLYRNINVAVVLGVAVVGAILSALFSGLLVPYVFRKFKFDPANASGPVGTIIQDILSVLIYFAVAAWIL